jgi:nitrogenase molybdenum-iron protein alpha/beta subunit
MKVAITGHTYGIGAALFEKLSPNAIGFSKSTGYDITSKEIRKRIIKESMDCDVFINNAPADFGQAELCLELWEEWKYLPKTIINVGSRIAEDHVTLRLDNSHLLRYSMHKRTLKKLSEDLSKIETPLTVKYKWFAYVGTSKILEKYPHFTKEDYISINEAVEIILND